MSSHHIVRENQEPALLIQDFNVLDRELINQILEWSPTVIVDEYSLDFLQSEEIKIDLVFSNKKLNNLQERTRILPIDEMTYLEAALSYLSKNSYAAVNILCARIDDIVLKYADIINSVVLCGAVRYVFVKGYYEKWKIKGDFVLVDPKKIKSCEGLRFINEDRFETIKDGFFRIDFKSTDTVCIGEVI